MDTKLKITERELLIRIDERQLAMNKSIDEIKLSLLSKVDKNDDYRQLEQRVNTMWDVHNKNLGYVAAISILLTIVSSFLFNVLQHYVLK